VPRQLAKPETILATDAQNAAGPADQPVLDPATQQFVDALAAAGAPPIHTLSPIEARKALADVQSERVGKPAARFEDITLPVGPTGSVRVRVVRPVAADGALPVLIYFPGGGWIMGDKDTYDRLIREIAVGVQGALFFVDYDRAPEAKYPIAVEQAYAVIKFVAEHGTDLHVDSTRLAILGDGAGGNLAAAVTLMASERRGPKIDLQVLLYPVVDANFDTGSYMTFARGPWLTSQAMEWFWNAYLPDISARNQITATPLNASVDQLTGLPDALVIVAENDVLRDEGECYAQKLALAGVRVTCTRYNGTIHDFLMLNALSDTPAACGALVQVTTALQAVLQ
jgi:acetyl esterase